MAHELKFTELYGARDPLREVRSIDELAGFADLRDRLQNNPFQLSYGQRQRLAIASLLATHPKALILDEPTTGQDEGHAQVVLDFLRRLQQTYGVALLMISLSLRRSTCSKTQNFWPLFRGVPNEPTVDRDLKRVENSTRISGHMPPLKPGVRPVLLPEDP
jgi:ABC-type Mn2+/Zn2+ transport system ATPase subunit